MELSAIIWIANIVIWGIVLLLFFAVRITASRRPGCKEDIQPDAGVTLKEFLEKKEEKEQED